MTKLWQAREKVIRKIITQSEINSFETSKEASKHGRSIGGDFFLIEDCEWGFNDCHSFEGSESLTPGDDWAHRWFVTHCRATVDCFLLLNKLNKSLMNEDWHYLINEFPSKER